MECSVYAGFYDRRCGGGAEAGCVGNCLLYAEHAEERVVLFYEGTKENSWTVK